jgi:hypothetical protein
MNGIAPAAGIFGAFSLALAALPAILVPRPARGGTSADAAIAACILLAAATHHDWAPRLAHQKMRRP